MAKTPEDILKKLKPTTAFDLTPEDMKVFATYVIGLGPDAFVTRWLQETAAKRAVKVSKPKVVDPRIAGLTTRLASFAKATRLKPAEAAVAFVNFNKEANPSIPASPASAQKGPAPAIKWLVSKSSIEAIEAQLSSFEERFA